MTYESIWDRLPLHKARSYLVHAIKRRNACAGLVRDDRVSDLADWFFNNQAWERAATTATALRRWGAPVAPNARREVAPTGRTRLGDQFLAILTAKGRADPKAASEAIVYWPWHEERQFHMGRLIVEEGTDIRYRVDARTCCAVALPYVKGVGSTGDAVTFPLPGCNRAKCTCSFERFSERIHGPVENDLREPHVLVDVEALIQAELLGAKALFDRRDAQIAARKQEQAAAALIGCGALLAGLGFVAVIASMIFK